MTQQPDPRPRPQYGEYAETSEPPEAPQQTDSAESTLTPESPASTGPMPSPEAAPVAAPSGAATAPSHPTSLPGVPHNLGANGSGTAQAQPQPQPAKLGEPYRASDAPTTHRPVQVTQNAKGQVLAAPRKGDRIVTIILLIVGGYAALQSAFSLMVMGAGFIDMATNVFNIEGFVLPQSVNTIGTVGAIVMLSLYALVLIFSIRRLRARKLTFWAPLAAGVLSVILMFAFFTMALTQSPELVQAGTDPAAFQQMLDYADSQVR